MISSDTSSQDDANRTQPPPATIINEQRRREKRGRDDPIEQTNTNTTSSIESTNMSRESTITGTISSRARLLAVAKDARLATTEASKSSELSPKDNDITMKRVDVGVSQPNPCARKTAKISLEENHIAAGCFISSLYSETMIGGTNAIISHFSHGCQSEAFINHCTNLGFSGVQFEPNVHLKNADNTGRQKFDKCIASESVELEKSGACLGIVFHGTARHNIDCILTNGLDQNKRRGQAFGPGEYFSKEPSLSISYCKGGLEILVFVAVLPQKSGNRTCPRDFVIVNNNGHHLALGVLKFHSATKDMMRQSQIRRNNYQNLCMVVHTKSQIKREAEIKAKIIQHLISSNIDTAAHIYKKHYSLLNDVSRSEVSWYVHQNVDKHIRSVYFSGLPDPMKLDEMTAANVQSLDDAIKQEQEAKKQLENARIEEAKKRMELGRDLAAQAFARCAPPTVGNVNAKWWDKIRTVGGRVNMNFHSAFMPKSTAGWDINSTIGGGGGGGNDYSHFSTPNTNTAYMPKSTAGWDVNSTIGGGGGGGNDNSHSTTPNTNMAYMPKSTDGRDINSTIGGGAGGGNDDSHSTTPNKNTTYIPNSNGGWDKSSTAIGESGAGFSSSSGGLREDYFSK